jgi:hypothetical protein
MIQPPYGEFFGFYPLPVSSQGIFAKARRRSHFSSPEALPPAAASVPVKKQFKNRCSHIAIQRRLSRQTG